MQPQFTGLSQKTQFIHIVFIVILLFICASPQFKKVSPYYHRIVVNKEIMQ